MAELYSTWKSQMIGGGDLTFWQEFFVKFYQAFVEKDRYLQYLKGMGTTLLVTAMALAIGVVLGIIVAVIIPVAVFALGIVVYVKRKHL